VFLICYIVSRNCIYFVIFVYYLYLAAIFAGIFFIFAFLAQIHFNLL
jgi:hypothetical protein